MTTSFSAGKNDLVLKNRTVVSNSNSSNNYIKINTDRSHFSLSGETQKVSNIDDNIIELENNQILLGILIDSNLTFEEHINNVCQKVSQKLNALARISNYMDIQKGRTIMKSFITSQFSYCPLIWMFHNRSLK